MRTQKQLSLYQCPIFSLLIFGGLIIEISVNLNILQKETAIKYDKQLQNRYKIKSR